MTIPLAAAAAAAAAVLFLSAVLLHPLPTLALGGSAATIAVVYGSTTAVCTIAAGQPIQQIQCWSNGLVLPSILPNTSFDAVAGGRDSICGIRSGGFSLICWNTTFSPKRLYNNASRPLTTLAVGDTQICALTNAGHAECWRGDSISPSRSPIANLRFRTISSGIGFSCGITHSGSRVVCWGDDAAFSNSIQSEFGNASMSDIYAGGRHACGITNLGFVICRGDNTSGQLNVPANSAYEYRGLALGQNHSCAIRRLNRTVVCWGGGEFTTSTSIDGISFETIAAGLNFTCGLVTTNFSVICWGSNFPNAELPLSRTLPGPCIDSPCPCNVYPQSHSLCSANGHICRPCDIPIPNPPAILPSPPPHSPHSRTGLLVFVIVGSVGGFAGICSLIYCVWTGVCFGKKKIHNSVQPTITVASNHGSSSNPPSRSSTIRRQGSILMRRQRSGPSSKHADRAEEYKFSELSAATDNFSLQNKIGAGSFGVVYKGKLADGREVAIKRSEPGKKFQEKETAFESELAFLSRLHHKHLVRLVGYCEEKDERLLVYEYMKNGALHNHLHGNTNTNVINSWKMRIKISLDAARGVEYLHSYAVPPIIHRDIKSSNILLDEDWSARVSDFGLSLLSPDKDREGGFRPAGTVGYIDPEYYGLNVVTAKSDVYGLGVVLLELLTGKRAIFKTSGGEPISVVEYAVPAIIAGEVERILDPRVGAEELEAVELMANTAMHCVQIEAKDRPTMTDVVANLERALALCQGDSHGSISIASD
ncbi:Putative serine/threonine-protein kinase-like protein CCR3 [Striga hermonthica]|uniref:non-specific serine/threonine protein kinase n=1 Tax=Striga hermonthica TaxID=68872 RepID=A0A9N7R7T2_STRHE|nr:Putative serine/threonine-protein kinase-like protein CCR3 [Striga hermonthica]